jgi:myb proto-oncogene protein
MIDRWARVLDPTMIDRSTTQWTLAEDARLLTLVRMLGMRWGVVAEGMPGLTNVQCRTRWFDHFDHRIDRETGLWTAQEDAQLTSAILRQQRHSSSVDVAAEIPTRLLHLKPTIKFKVGKWTDDEGAMLTKAVRKHGNNWIAIAKEVPGRSNVQCQKRWTTAVVHNRVWATGDWTAAEDAMLISGVAQHGRSWGMVAGCVTDRSHAQCRRRFEESQSL